MIHWWNVIVFIPGLEGMVGAMWKAVVSLVLLILSPGGDGLFRSVYRNVQVSTPQKGGVGQPLFLTPYVKAGNFKEGKLKSENHWLLSTVFFF